MLFQFYGNTNFVQVFRYLESFGLLDALVPFVLIFAVFFAVMQQVRVFGETKKEKKDNVETEVWNPNKKVNLVVSLAVSLMTVIPHVLGRYPPNADVVVIINSAAPEIALIMFAVLLVLVLTGFLSNKKQDANESFLVKKAPWIALILVLIVFWGAISPWVPGFAQFLADPAFFAIMIILLVFALVIWAVTKA